MCNCQEPGWLVYYECFSGYDSGWGKTGARTQIRFPEYNLTMFQNYAPGGWEITRIDRVGNHYKEED